MRISLLETVSSGNEVSHDLCVDTSNEIHLENRCEGNTCEVIHKSYCSKNKKLIGNYHTHPAGGPPSLQDLITAYVRGIGCIGNVKKMNIDCFVRKGDLIEKEFATLLDAERKYGEPHDEKTLELHHDSSKIAQDKLFRKTKI